MKKIFLTALLTLCFTVTLISQKSYDYLVKYLPKIDKVGEFVKDEVLIDDPCDACLPTVTVLYLKKGLGDINEDMTDLGRTISISITDAKDNIEYINAMLDYSGSSQSFMVFKDKYEGWKEIVENDYGVQQCTYTYAVENRFLIQINGGYGNVLKEMDVLVDDIDHVGLKNQK